MTTLYLCRHAIAVDPTGSMTDADRPLTPEGIKKFRKAARGFVELLDKDGISQILTSPLLRARQTAEILAEALAAAHHETPVQQTAALEPPGDLKQLVKEIHALKKAAAVIAVGHEPTLGEWVGELCFDRPGRVQLKKGAIAAIELADLHAKGELLWLLQPGTLRGL